ncbi:MAG TPA: hypothetical protein VM032_03735 [Vicinamibacterales bacterium]|nr:hypothetical protein [Vicinamibacterales bacterium]
MPEDNAAAQPDPSHDDVSNSGPGTPPAVPAGDDDAHDRNDDGPSGRSSSTETAQLSKPTQPVAGKPMSDMAPPGSDDSEGSE